MDKEESHGSGPVLVRRLIGAKRETRERLLAGLAADELRQFDLDWSAWVHEGQAEPAGEDWRVWVMLAGRGFGKTRAGAEWVSEVGRRRPGAAIALVAATVEEARAVMVEGRSGLLAVARPHERKAMAWEPSRRRLRFASGAEAFLYSGAHADGLRGPEHHLAWCDELAKWAQAQAAWDNLMLGLRLVDPSTGAGPRALVTTTPRPMRLLKTIIGAEGSVRSGGATGMNPHLAGSFVAAMERAHGGTRFGRQELGGELIEEVEGALWPRALLDACRVPLDAARGERFGRVVIGVDPPAGMDGDACGIVAVGLDRDGVAHVLADHSVAGLSPDGWARKVAAAVEAHGAALVVAEANNGGAMVEAVLRGAGLRLPVRLVHASERKVARAAPVATLFESGRAKLAGRFAALEDELAGLSWSGAYDGPGRSPDRADAMVWAMTELMLRGGGAEPRIRVL
nr:terminase family protein [uncultured Sphingosinicella sp.]